ncbi:MULTISPECIES: ScbA/BarX family gamma-butyrolactone biosynthesis protein [Streptomyces]|uniref:ScbA/BarX family gamma-butyrolactone biosynthesis protein n=1 Tax=Streptomyces TaxID=1883 RepID=UPI001F08ADE3|nr:MULTISPECIES: ScbA/BarX family gamma-butyrolactone biosynthesis protein [Streptomyces]
MAHPARDTGLLAGQPPAIPSDHTAVQPAYQTVAPVLLPAGRATGELCHRPDPEDRFPVDWLRLSEHRFLVSVNWPAAHRFFAPLPDGRQDPLLVAETTRQATMMLAHAEFGVPIGDQFVMRELGYRIETPDFTVDNASGAIEVVVECSDVQLRAGRLVGMRVDLRFQRLDQVLATSMGILVCTSARVYRRLRGERMSAPSRPVPLLAAVTPHETGRVDRKDVVLALSKHRPGWRLRLDTTHPTLFARPNDHVPGMVLLEAARQAATALTPGHDFHPVSMRISFDKYCELTEPCWILARHDVCPEQGAVLRVQGVQQEEPVFTAILGGAVRESR